MEPFGLIHRDFSACNLHLVARNGSTSGAQLKVLDFGVMISTEQETQTSAQNETMKAFRRCMATKGIRPPALPWEVRAGVNGNGPVMNYALPVHSFDVFSVGVLSLSRTSG